MAAVLGPGESDGAHGGGFPGAGRGDREPQPCPRGAHLADERGLSSIEGGAVRRHLEQGQLDRGLLDGRTAALSGRGDEAGLGVEDPLRGVEGGAGDGVDRRPADPLQHLGFLDAVVRSGQGNRSTIEHLIDQEVYQRRGMFSRNLDGADLPLCFGPDVPHLPGRPARLDNGQDVISCLCDPVGVGDRSGLGVRCQCRLHHRRDSAMSAQHRRGLAKPGCALLSQGAGFVFGVAGLQRRLLRQMQRFDRGRWPAMIILETDGQLAAAGIDVAVDQRLVSRESTPTISRIGRLVGSVPGRSANRTPNVSRRCCSSAVL